MINIGLIEDQTILLENYKDFFEREAYFNLIFAVNDIRLLVGNPFNYKVDVILLDIKIRGRNSLNDINIIKTNFPDSLTIVLSGVTDEITIQQAFKLGLNGYLSKTSSLQFISDAIINSVKYGGLPISPIVAKFLLPQSFNIKQRFPSLTSKEIELIKLLNTGLPLKLVAERLNRTYFTVNHHLKNIYKKLQINSRSELTVLTMK